jgi:hypothetical protein
MAAGQFIETSSSMDTVAWEIWQPLWFKEEAWH